MTHLPLPPPHHLKHALGLGTKHPGPPQPFLQTSYPSAHSTFLRSLFHPPLPITPRAATLPIFFYLYKNIVLNII